MPTPYARDVTMGPTWAVAPTASDTADQPSGIRSIWVSSAGNVRVTLLDMEDGTYVTYPSLAVGRHVLQVKRLWSTGTTATVAFIEG